MKRTRRNHGAAFKPQVAFAAVNGDKTPAELATQFSVHPTQITEWTQQVLPRAIDVFGGTKATSDAPDLVAFSPQEIAQHAGSGKRRGQMELVDPAHQRKIR